MEALQPVTSVINEIFKSDALRMFTVVLTGIWAGYVLQPVPRWLNNLFDTSNVFKFVILILIGIGVTYPVNPASLISIVVVSVAIMIIFELFRRVKVETGPPRPVVMPPPQPEEAPHYVEEEE